MSKKRLEHMKECLISVIENEMCNLSNADTKELGEAIDMVKDLEEAIYYCTITEAMKSEGGEYHHMEEDKHYMDNNRRYMDGGNQSYYEYPMSYRQARNSNGEFMSSRSSGNNDNYYDPMSGRSHQNRRMYMEAKMNHHDKASQLRELEKYMQELSGDITEMISDATTEEKQYLEKKLSALAGKIGAMK